jgi:hypothetical protein
MGHFIHHNYQSGDELSCSVCKKPVYVTLFNQGKAVIGRKDQVSDWVFLCDGCGKVFCVSCAQQLAPTGTPHCDACSGIIGAPQQNSAVASTGKAAVLTEVDRLNSEVVPPASHQADVHRMAKEYLTACLKLDKQALSDLLARFQNDRLLGLEVLDEAMVLYKNDPSTWPLSQMGVAMMTKYWQAHYDEVMRMRGGRERQTTTPTLRGGGKRSPGW